MKMKRLYLTIVVFMTLTGVCAAGPWEFDLSAGSSSVAGGLHYKNYMDTGYLRVGASGVYTDDDNTEYKWATFDFTVGSDILRPGLSVDVGLRAIAGTAEDGRNSGDVGAAAFTILGDYYFSRDVMPIPLEIYSGLTWGPKPLTFEDTDNYFQFDLGVGIQLIRNASVMLSYTAYRVGMDDTGAGDWDLNDDVLRAGIIMRF